MSEMRNVSAPFTWLFMLSSLWLPILANAGDHIRWTEEVKLSDGKVIQIQRHTELTAPVFPVSKRGLVKYHEICYAPMGIHWKSRGGYKPDIFDIVDGKVYIHVPVNGSLECWEQGYPKTGAIHFVWKAGQWKRISPEEFPAASEWNLLMWTSGGTTSTDPRGLVTLTDKTTHEYWNDSGLRFEQKHFGGKRVNEFYSSREGCKPYENVKVQVTYGSDAPKREDCKRDEQSPATCPISILVENNVAACQP